MVGYIKNSVMKNRIIEMYIYDIYSETKVAKNTMIFSNQSVLKCILLHMSFHYSGRKLGYVFCKLQFACKRRKNIKLELSGQQAIYLIATTNLVLSPLKWEGDHWEI